MKTTARLGDLTRDTVLTPIIESIVERVRLERDALSRDCSPEKVKAKLLEAASDDAEAEAERRVRKPRLKSV